MPDKGCLPPKQGLFAGKGLNGSIAVQVSWMMKEDSIA